MQKKLDYTVIRSSRRTLALQLTPDGLTVRAPYGTGDAEISRFVESHRQWIESHAVKMERAAAAMADLQPLTPEEIRALADRALRYIPERVAYYAARMGVTYGRITIRNQRSRWGSCTAQGNLNFNCLLMLAPPEVTDSVIVHELAHRKEMNHSPAFYAAVLEAFPEYDKWNAWLKENGPLLMKRMTG